MAYDNKLIRICLNFDKGITQMNLSFEELERKYYMEGNVEKARIFSLLDEQELTINYLQEELQLLEQRK